MTEAEVQVESKSLERNRWSFEFPSQISFDIANEVKTETFEEDYNEPIQYFSKYVEPKIPISALCSMEDAELTKFYAR